MTEFVEHSGYIIKAEESGLALHGLGKIKNVIDHRLDAKQFGWIDKLVHPGAAIFIIALEIIAIPKRQRFAVGIEDFEDAHIRVVHRKVVGCLEAEPVKLAGGGARASREHVVEFEIRITVRVTESTC